MARNLRIGVSAFFGLLTLLLVVLWVRSYWTFDAICHKHPVTMTECETATGFVGIGKWKRSRIPSNYEYEWLKSWSIRTTRRPDGTNTMFEWSVRVFLFQRRDGYRSILDRVSQQPSWQFAGFRIKTWGSGWIAVAPFWALVGTSCSMAALPWVKRNWFVPPHRFSLRTLLIATTLLAAVLGLAVWAGR
jgi:hypothetical protein